MRRQGVLLTLEAGDSLADLINVALGQVVDPLLTIGEVRANPSKLSGDAGRESRRKSVEASGGTNISDIGDGRRDNSLGCDGRHCGLLMMYNSSVNMRKDEMGAVKEGRLALSGIKWGPVWLLIRLL